MRSIVTIIFNERQSLEYVVDIDHTPEAQAMAQDWLEATWVRLECEPLRHSGKVLLLDKVLGVADSLGYSRALSSCCAKVEYLRLSATRRTLSRSSTLPLWRRGLHSTLDPVALRQ